MKTNLNAVKSFIQAFISDEEGTAALEYTLVAGTVSIAAGTALGALADRINDALALVVI